MIKAKHKKIKDGYISIVTCNDPKQARAFLKLYKQKVGLNELANKCTFSKRW